MENIVEGSEYIIRSLGGKDAMLMTKGTFIGYSAIGKSEGGICIKLDKSHGDLAGKTRIIPISMILSIDILQKVEDTTEKEESHYHF